MAVIVASDIVIRYSVKTGSAGNTVAGTGAGSLGKYVSTTTVPSSSVHALFDAVSGSENAASDVEYRCIFILNNHATEAWTSVVVWVSNQVAGGASYAISVDTTAASAKGSSSAQAKEVANEDTAPTSQTFTAPTTEGTALSVGTIPAGQVKAIWVRRTANNTAAMNNDGATLSIKGDYTSTFAWPNASNVGLLVATTTTRAGGATYATVADLLAHGATGSGTYASPYTIDRTLYTGKITLGDWVTNNLQGKWVKFTNCRGYGEPANPTPFNGIALEVRRLGPFVITEDSTWGPNDDPENPPGADLTAGNDKSLLFRQPFEVRRCNVFGACVQVYFETERGDGLSIIEGNYLHHTWSSAGDHTDIINGNFHASHILCRDNYMDGVRVGGSRVTNGFGIYDDPAVPLSNPAGIIEDWEIDHNYLTRCATGLLCSNYGPNSPGPGGEVRFVDPFIVTDNVFAKFNAGDFPVGRFDGRAPSTQSGNVDENNNPLTFPVF